MLEQWLRTVRGDWPQCPALICTDGRHLRIAPASAVLRGMVEYLLPGYARRCLLEVLCRPRSWFHKPSCGDWATAVPAGRISEEDPARDR